MRISKKEKTKNQKTTRLSKVAHRIIYLVYGSTWLSSMWPLSLPGFPTPVDKSNIPLTTFISLLYSTNAAWETHVLKDKGFLKNENCSLLCAYVLTRQLTVQKISFKLEENEYKRRHMTASCFGTIFLWDISQTEGIELNS